MNKKIKIEIASGVVLFFVILASLVIWHKASNSKIILDNAIKNSILDSNGIINCGQEKNNYLGSDWHIRECIMKAFSQCSPAFASEKWDGVSWESSAGEKNIEVIRKDNSCFLHFSTKGGSSFGDYDYSTDCKNYEISKDFVNDASSGTIVKKEWNILLLKDCSDPKLEPKF